MNELKNPFKNARIVRENCETEVYLGSTGDERGKPGRIMGRSELMDFRSCPQRWLLGYREEESESTEFGTLVDCVVLQPHEFNKRFAVRPATYKDAKTGEDKKWTMAANACKDWAAQHAGKQIVSPDDNAAAHSALNRITEDPNTKALLDCSKRQVFILADYEDEDTGIVVPVKALIDLVPDAKHELFGKCLCDLKTTRCAHPLAWQKTVEQRNYHVQAGHFLWMYEAATGEDRNTFLHLLVENIPPYEPGRRVLSLEYLELGRMRLLNALRDYCRCLAENTWPGYERPENCLPMLQGWAITAPTAWQMQQAE